MAGSNGVSFTIEVSSDGGATYQLIAGAKGASLKRKAGVIDVTTKDSAGDEEGMAGKRSWEISFDQLFVASDAAQTALHNAWRTGATVKVRVKQGNSSDTMIGTANITDLSEDYPNMDAVTFSGTLQGTGALVPAGAAH